MKKRKRTAKYHLYLENAKRTQLGDRKTACGRDGYHVGGFISFFFKACHIEERCKICDKIYQGLKNET